MALKIGVAGMLLAIALSVGCNDEQRLNQLQNELHATAEARQAAADLEDDDAVRPAAVR